MFNRNNRGNSRGNQGRGTPAGRSSFTSGSRSSSSSSSSRRSSDDDGFGLLGAFSTGFGGGNDSGCGSDSGSNDSGSCSSD